MAVATLDAVDGSVSTKPIEYGGHSVATSSSSTMLAIPAVPMPGATYVVGVVSKPYRAVAGVSGLDATWTRIADQCGARSQTGAALYVGRGAIESGNVSVTLTSAATNAIGVVAAYRGSTSNGASAVYNALDATTCNASDTNVDVSAYSVPIAATGHVIGVVATRQATHSPGEGLVQRLQDTHGSSGDTAGIAIVDGVVTGVSGTLSSEIDVAVVAVELR